MHRNKAFARGERDELLRFVGQVSFAHIGIAVEGRPMVAHAPLAVSPAGGLLFHLARANRIVPHLHGAVALATVVGEHFYVSPDWYGTDDQVPTWNYRLVECEGMVRRLDDAALRDQVDLLSATHEAGLAPKSPWTSAKMQPARLASMLRGIVGFAIDAPLLRGVAKLGQTKAAAEIDGAIAGLRGIGREAAAAEMAALR